MQIPNKAIKPIPADIEIEARYQKGCDTSTAANGTFSNTSPASLALEKRINRIMKIMAMLMQELPAPDVSKHAADSQNHPSISKNILPVNGREAFPPFLRFGNCRTHIRPLTRT